MSVCLYVCQLVISGQSAFSHHENCGHITYGSMQNLTAGSHEERISNQHTIQIHKTGNQTLV